MRPRCRTRYATAALEAHPAQGQADPRALSRRSAEPAKGKRKEKWPRLYSVGDPARRSLENRIPDEQGTEDLPHLRLGEM